MPAMTQGERIEGAKSVHMAKEFGFPMLLDSVNSEGKQAVVVRAPNRPELVLGYYNPSTTLFVGEWIFAGRFLEGPWEDVESNLYYYIDAWLGVLPTTDTYRNS